MGLRRFIFRGVTEVRDEWELPCAALNLRRLLALGVAGGLVRRPRAVNPRFVNGAARERGRRRSAYEAPRVAADRGTRLGGAESKRRRRPRLPAPPSRVTLLD